MTQREMTRQEYEGICLRLGVALQLWATTMWHLEVSICTFMSEDYPPNENFLSCLMRLPDGVKITMLKIRYVENPEYHNILDIQEAVKFLNAGLNARNYFAHTQFGFNKEGVLVARSRGTNSEPQARFSPVPAEFLDEKRAAIMNAHNILADFTEKTLYGKEALKEQPRLKTLI